MADDHDHGEGDRPDYDPSDPTPPERQPPVRSTAPQSTYTMGQVGFGLLVLVVGVIVTFGLPLVLI